LPQGLSRYPRIFERNTSHLRLFQSTVPCSFLLWAAPLEIFAMVFFSLYVASVSFVLAIVATHICKGFVGIAIINSIASANFFTLVYKVRYVFYRRVPLPLESVVLGLELFQGVRCFSQQIK